MLIVYISLFNLNIIFNFPPFIVFPIYRQSILLVCIRYEKGPHKHLHNAYVCVCILGISDGYIREEYSNRKPVETIDPNSKIQFNNNISNYHFDHIFTWWLLNLKYWWWIFYSIRTEYNWTKRFSTSLFQI